MTLMSLFAKLIVLFVHILRHILVLFPPTNADCGVVIISVAAFSESVSTASTIDNLYSPYNGRKTE